MNIKNVRVEIKSLKEVLGDTARVIGKLKRDETVKPKRGVSFGSIESFRQFFTPKRLELLRVIKHRRPQSIYELAKLIKRDIKSVAVDIKILERYSLIDTKKIAVKGGYKVKPIFDYDKLNVEIAI